MKTIQRNGWQPGMAYRMVCAVANTIYYVWKIVISERVLWSMKLLYLALVVKDMPPTLYQLYVRVLLVEHIGHFVHFVSLHMASFLNEFLESCKFVDNMFWVSILSPVCVLLMLGQYFKTSKNASLQYITLSYNL